MIKTRKNFRPFKVVAVDLKEDWRPKENLDFNIFNVHHKGEIKVSKVQFNILR